MYLLLDWHLTKDDILLLYYSKDKLDALVKSTPLIELRQRFFLQNSLHLLDAKDGL